MTRDRRHDLGSNATAERRRPPPLGLREEDLRHAVGGRKAGKGQQEYYRVVMKDLLISAF
ncbi:MAG TPA: hypothetical protein VFK85_12260 [Anaeromyxobacteraceae bacterium]|nr:hypothetical protein [Anaeromyxobacteraceae bacterium]